MEKVLRVTGFTKVQDIKNQQLAADAKVLLHTVENITETHFGVTTTVSVKRSFVSIINVYFNDIKNKDVEVTINEGKLPDGSKVEFISAIKVKGE